VFLYDPTHPDPIQKGVAANAVKPLQAAVMRGRLLRRNDTPIDGVQVSVLLSIREDDVSFLAQIPSLRGLVLNGGGVRDLSPVQALGALETLTLNTPAKPKLPLDFAAFPALKTLRMYWNAGFESVFGCESLEALFVFGPPDPDLARFGTLPRLRRLEVSQGRKLVSTAGVGGSVRFLGLYQQAALSALEGLPALDVLAIEGAKQLGELRTVHTLKTLKAANCGDIASLAPLRGLDRLEEFFAWESTRVLDGDLSVLLELPRLRTLGMRDRREYRPRVAEIEAALRGR
jgi:internalin A